MTTKKEKPPAQVAGVQGFNAFTTPIDETKQPSIDWQKLTGLPPFEMFVLEQSGQIGSMAAKWVATQRGRLGDEKLYQLYSDWHKAKGYWKNEDYYGNLKGGDQ